MSKNRNIIIIIKYLIEHTPSQIVVMHKYNSLVM